MSAVFHMMQVRSWTVAWINSAPAVDVYIDGFSATHRSQIARDTILFNETNKQAEKRRRAKSCSRKISGLSIMIIQYTLLGRYASSRWDKIITS